MDQSIKRIKPTTFELVSKMNTAFGNPKGDSRNIDWDRIRAQCKNIHDEYLELLFALGAKADVLDQLSALHKTVNFTDDVHPEEVRDALCDINVFSMGAQHLMGVDGDADMQAVIDGVMTRFVKDPEDLRATMFLHASKGISYTYTEGEYPIKILKSAEDQPDAPKGKFLKSASYKQTIFPPLY